METQTAVKKNLYTDLTISIIQLLEEQQLSWDKPWIGLDDFGGMARNADSGRIYSLMNQILLGMQLRKHQYQKNAWLTFKQIAKLGGSVKKGEKSTTIYFNKYIYKDKDDKNYSWDDVKKMSKEHKEKIELKSQYFLNYYLVFNLSQTKGLPAVYYELPKAHRTITFEMDKVVSRLINQFGSTQLLDFKDIDAAFYDKQKDCIVLPKQRQFNSEEAYYNTLFHEWIHWTGHESRLNRSFLYGATDDDYAHEELIAELGAVFICAQLGLPITMTQNAAYIQSWLKSLSEDERYIMKMVFYAEKACKFILSEFNIAEESNDDSKTDNN